MSIPTISIIIPTFNRADLIGETLDSIIAQTYTHWECVVVDDGSTDNTDEIVEAYAKENSLPSSDCSILILCDEQLVTNDKSFPIKLQVPDSANLLLQSTAA